MSSSVVYKTVSCAERLLRIGRANVSATEQNSKTQQKVKEFGQSKPVFLDFWSFFCYTAWLIYWPIPMKNLIKKLVSFAVLGMVLLPAQFASASTILATDFGDSTGTLLENVANAESVDFSVDVDAEIRTADMDQPVKVHLDLNAVSSLAGNSRFDFGASATDQNGAFNESNGSVILTQDTVYFSDDGNEWYFAKQSGASDYPTAENTEEGITEAQDFLDDMFDRGIISYQLETVDFINKKPAVRYAYTVNTDRFVDYLVEKKLIPADEEDAARTYLAEHVTVGGSFWVNTIDMLPVMFTVNVNVQQSTTSYTTVGVSVLFKSFNEPVNITLPTNATDIADYRMSSTDEETIESLGEAVLAMDTDGDGLSNADEESVWYSNPLSSDTDGDGYADYTEVINGYDPNGSGKLDSDADGLTDYAEMTIHWSNRFDADSDNDGYNDGLEIANGYNPNGTGRW